MPLYRINMTMHSGRLKRRVQDEGLTFKVSFPASNRRQAMRRIQDYLCNRYVMAFGKMETARTDRPK